MTLHEPGPERKMSEMTQHGPVARLDALGWFRPIGPRVVSRSSILGRPGRAYGGIYFRSPRPNDTADQVPPGGLPWTL